MNTIPQKEGLNEQMIKAIRRLCHFIPPADCKNLPSSLHECLVKHAMMNLGIEEHTLEQIKNSLHDLFKLDFENEELTTTLERLDNQGLISSSSENSFALSVDEYTELEKTLRDLGTFEELTIDEWLDNIKVKYSNLSQDDIRNLKEDLSIYLAEIFARHGAECVALLYAGQEKAEKFIQNLADEVFENLPHRSPRLHQIRIIELPSFFRDASSERKQYIAQLLDSTFMIYMLSIDKDCSTLIKRQFRGYRLYLDTNFIYRLLGLNGPVLQKAALTATKIASDVGFLLIVSSRTIKEWKTSIEYTTKRLKKHPQLSPELAQVGADYTTEDDLVTAYWREYARTQISIADFFALYQRIEDLLKENNIHIKDTLCDKIEEDADLAQEVSKLQVATENVKRYEVAEHDAFHRLLIIRFRGKEQPETFVDTKIWFLTCDTLLPKYDRFVRKKYEKVSFCILVNQWIQTMRPLLPRTKDFDETFVDLFTSPYLRTYGSLPSNIAQTVLSRIDQLKDHSAELGIRVLTDRHLAKELRETDEEEKIKELIDSATIKAAEEFRKERDQLKKELEEVRKGKKEFEERLDEEKLYHDQKRSKFIKTLWNNKESMAAMKQELQDGKNERKLLEKKTNRIIACFILTLVIVIAIFVPWKNMPLWAKSVVAGGIILGTYAALSFPFGTSKTTKIFRWIAIFCSIMSFLYIFMIK